MAFPTTARLLLPAPLSMDSALLRTNMESGPVKQAKIKSLQNNRRDLVYRMTGDEYDAFKNWHKTEINRGATYYPWIDLDGTERQVLMVDGKYTDTQVRIADDSPVEYEVAYTVEWLE